MADLKAKLRLTADGKQARRELGGVQKGVASLAKGLAVAAAVTAVITKAVQAFVAVLQDAILKASEAQRAVKGLEAAFRVAGDEGAAEAAREVLGLAQVIERTTDVSKEAVLQSAALARSFVTSADAAAELTQAAVDFAQGAGLGLTEATRRLGRAMQGSTEDIAKFVPEIKELTKAQLEAGEATRLISERFEGSAAAAADTYASRAQNVAEAVGNISEAMGEAVVSSDDVAASQELAALAMQKVAEQAEQGIGLFGVWDTFTTRLVTGFNNLKSVLGLAVVQINSIGGALADTSLKTIKLKNATDALVETEARAVRIEKERKNLLDETTGLLEELGIRTQPAVAEALEDTAEKQTQLNELYRQGLLDVNQYEFGSAQLRKEQESLQAVLDGTVANVTEYSESLGEAELVTDNAATATDRLGLALEGAGNLARAAALGVNSFNAATRGTGGDEFFRDSLTAGQRGRVSQYGFDSSGREKITPFNPSGGTFTQS